MKNKTTIIIVGLFILAFSLRSLNLSRGYDGDEGITLRSAQANFSAIIPTLLKYDAHPPLTSFLLHFWMRISQNEIFIRYYFILFGIGVLWVIYLIANEYLNQKRDFALLVLFLAAISPLLISMSQFIRNYIDSAFWMLLSNYFLLLIVKNKANSRVWIGYCLVSLLSIYTFYYSAFMIFSQSIYMFIFKNKEHNIIKRWILSQGAIGLFFLPWLPYFWSQIFNQRSCRFLPWEKIGFRFGGLELGIYARNISSLFGFDYFFMFYPQGIRSRFAPPFLFLMVALAFLLLFYFLFSTMRWLRKDFIDSPELIWFLPFLSLLPVVVSWITAKATKALPTARYLVAPHGIFLILIGYFFYSLISRYRKTGTIFLLSLICLYILRIPCAVTPAYEAKKAVKYLQGQVREGDCIVMIESLSGRESLPVPLFSIENYLFETDHLPLTPQYHPLAESDTEKIEDTLKPFKRIWFISCYGNTEIFGANKVAYEFLKRCGREEIAAKEFHNIKVTLME